MTKNIPDVDLSRFPDARPREDSSHTPAVRVIPDENLARFPDAVAGESRLREPAQLGVRTAAHARLRGQLWFWFLLTLLSLAALSLVSEIHWLLQRSNEVHPLYAWAGGCIISLFVLLLTIIIWQEVYAYLQLKSCHTLQQKYGELEAHLHDVKLNKEVQQLVRGYLKQLRKTARGELLAKINRAEARIALADDALIWKEDLEQTVLAVMDEQVRQVIRQEAINVGIGTAISPSGFVDVVITLWRNVRVVRRIAELYQLRTGVYGTFRLVRETLTAVTLADLSEEASNVVVSSFGGVPFLARAGEGVLNAGFTVRIGFQAQRECRPIAFSVAQQHSALSELMNIIVGAIRAATGWTVGARGKDKHAGTDTAAEDPQLAS